jgi:hypothetical protein
MYSNGIATTSEETRLHEIANMQRLSGGKRSITKTCRPGE